MTQLIEISSSYFLQRTAFFASGRNRNIDHNDGDLPDVHKKLPSSAGEDRAMLLGFAMMGFSVLMFFLFGITILKPFLLRSETLLHYNEEAVQINSKCFYTPKGHQDRSDLLNSALDIKEFFDHKNGTPFSCFYSPESQFEDVILIKKYDQMFIFYCLFWPALTLLGGALIVGMVRLTQYLSLLCEKYSTAHRDEVGGKVPYMEQHRFKLWSVGRSQERGREISR
ncbi:hypothetical protein GH733_002809, partial [Mirounga leonina]